MAVGYGTEKTWRKYGGDMEERRGRLSVLSGLSEERVRRLIVRVVRLGL